jgi:hypothetical protein
MYFVCVGSEQANVVSVGLFKYVNENRLVLV